MNNKQTTIEGNGGQYGSCYTTEELKLIQMYCNAFITYLSCGGHHKAFMNEMRAKALKAEIEAKGLHVPDREEVKKIGIFNGEGSY